MGPLSRAVVEAAHAEALFGPNPDFSTHGDAWLAAATAHADARAELAMSAEPREYWVHDLLSGKVSRVTAMSIGEVAMSGESVATPDGGLEWKVDIRCPLTGERLHVEGIFDAVD